MAPAAPSPPSVFRALRYSFWDLYDNIGAAMLANLLWTVSIAAAAVPASYHPLFGLMALVTVPGGMAVTVVVGGFAARGENCEVRTVIRRSLALWGRMFFLLVLDLAILGMGVLNVNFYLVMSAGLQAQSGPLRWAFLFALGLSIWLLATFVLMHLYLPAFIADRRTGIWQACKRAALSVVGYPGTSLVAGVCLLLLLGLSAVSVFGLGILFVSYFSVFSTHLAGMVSGEERDGSAYEHRSLRELLPWSVQQ